MKSRKFLNGWNVKKFEHDSMGEVVLLVEDNFNNIKLLVKILEVQGYEVGIASSGEEALRIAPGLKPDLILLDIMLPGMDGFEICEKLKENEATQSIPVIFISAKASSEDIVKGFEVGGMDYITKPFNISEVLARVRTQLQLQNLIIQKEKSEQKARTYAKKLEQSNKDLEEFAELASHDLQEPLRKIITFGKCLVEQSESMDDKAKDYLNRMQKASVRMENLITDLLEYSKIESSPQPRKLTDISRLVHEVLDNLDIQIKKNEAVIQIEELPTLEMSPAHVSTILQNLISNAIKYHREGVTPVVKVFSSYDKDFGLWNIHIEDNGIGIKEKYFDRIFNLFQRLHGRSAYDGTGMGLSICQKLAVRHGGNITVQSREGEGSTFTIKLPQRA